MVNIKCPNCSTSKYSENNEFTKILGLNPPFVVVECHKCELKSLLPQLTDLELNELYADAYFNNFKPTSLKFKDLVPLTQYETDVRSRFSKFRDTITNFNIINSNFKKMLDVGAATGDMVNIASEMGYQAEGIELSKYAITRAKELYNIELKQLFLSDIESNSFELVHLNHVFEHFNDPLTELNHLNRILVNSGILYIEIPYQFHLIERIKYKFFSNPRPFTLHSIHHPYFYSPRTIKSMVRKSGFEIIKLNIFSSKRYMETNNNWFKMIFWQLISVLKIGNYIELYAKKSKWPNNKLN